MVTTNVPLPRLVVIEANGISVYESGKRLAFAVTSYAYTAQEIEEVRTQQFDMEKSACLLKQVK